MTLACMVCGGRLRPYFRKDYKGLHGLGTVHYERCQSCGFVLSRTHFEMSDSEWGRLNTDYHATRRGHVTPPVDDPRWIERLRKQAVCLQSLERAGVLPHQLPWIDYGCGDGKLASYLCDLNSALQRFDPFMTVPGYLTREDLRAGCFDLVLNTSVIEHVRDRGPLDEMARLVAPNGVFAIHTLVREEIPADPNWFYLVPVHCALFTNRSMQLLFEQWNFRYSLYHVDSRLWLWFRDESDPLRRVLRDPGRYLTGEIYYKQGFADYWK